MDTTIVLNNLLSLIRSMPLTTSNKEWLADHLYEEGNYLQHSGR